MTATPQIEKPKTGGLSFLTKGGGKPQFTPASAPVPIIKIEKPFAQPPLIQIHFKIGKILDKIKEAKQSEENRFTRQSIGYIALMNYINDQNSGKTMKHSRSGHFHKNQGGAEAKLVTKNSTRYVPPTKIKVAQVWEDDSMEAFQISVNFLLNRLTEGQLQTTIEELRTHIKDDTHITFTSKFIVEKAMIEHAFAPLYARLIKQLGNEKMRKMVVTKTMEELDDFLLNVPESEEDGIRAKGTALFLASLITNQIIEAAQGIDKLSEILAKLKETRNEKIVGILETFITKSEKEFVLKITPKQWEIFDEIIKTESTGTYKGCMLLNIQETKELYINNRQITRIAVEDLKNADEILDVLRSAYCSFNEGTPIEDIKYDSNKFLEAALHQLPDHTKDAADYAIFIGMALPKCQKPEQKAYQPISSKYAEEIVNEKLADETPKIWNAFFNVLVALFTFGHIGKDKASEVASKIPGAKDLKIDFLEEAKYFLFDNFDFSQSFKVQTQYNELSEALMMPDNIDQRDVKAPLSRLIAVAICRVVVNKVMSAGDKYDEVIQKYAKHLGRLKQTLPQAMEDEINFASDEYGFPYNYNELCERIH